MKISILGIGLITVGFVLLAEANLPWQFYLGILFLVWGEIFSHEEIEHRRL